VVSAFHPFDFPLLAEKAVGVMAEVAVEVAETVG